MRISAKTDVNQAIIVRAFRRLGCHVILTHQLKNAFDCLVFHKGNIYPVEIKDGTKPPSARKLTEGEQKCKEAIEATGCQYHVITNVEDAIKLIYKQ